ncbi:lipopolysaccharide biosynthesis protein [Erythrobacter aureus]|uniref:Lipopolysaccharide biosynthesis protein n=2 Tax=Erythrobacter aureus TaxID=2182384 RepID=A0A345YFZ7_9SPHN|nr:lipopolysaccharide biosynthesis protein [Erythrobacter aureus]
MFRNLRGRIMRGEGFLRNISVLMAGTIAAHMITVAGIPITTRLFNPEAFSILAIYSAILSILLTLVTLSMHLGIPIAATHRQALSLVAGSALIIVIFTVVLSFAVVFGSHWIIGALGRPDFEPYLPLLIPGCLLGGGYALLQMWFSRRKQFGLVARTRVVRSAGGTGTQLAFGFAGGGPVGLVLGHLLYNGLGVFGLSRRLIRDEAGKLKELTVADVRQGLRSNKKFAIFTTPENLANVAAIQLPVLAIAANPETGEVGQLYLAQSIMMLPMMLIGSSVGQAFIADAPEYFRRGELWHFTKRVLRGLTLTGAPLLLLAGLIAPFLAGPILGEGWTRTGELIAWITPWMILQFLSSPLSTIFYIAGKQWLALLVQLIGLCLRFGVVLVAISMAPGWAMEAYALSGAAFYLSMLVVMLAVARKRQ